MRSPLIILAGGKGTRLREITGPNVPKPMVDVFGRPFLYWLVKHYRSQGFTNITVSVGHLADMVRNYAWPWDLRFEEDVYEGCHEEYYNAGQGHRAWVVNGDTFIPDRLIATRRPTIMSCDDQDAGAQFVTTGKIGIEPCFGFYDIGTPEGLERFKVYFKTHPLYLEEMTQLDNKQASDNLVNSSKGGTYDDSGT